MPKPESRPSDPPQHRLLRTAQQYEDRPRKFVLPISAPVLLNQQNARIHTKSQVAGLSANRLLVANPQHWRILSLRVGSRIGGLEIRGDHPALLDPRPGTPSRLPLLSIESDVELEVGYVGPRADVDKVYFVGCLCLEEDSPESSFANARISQTLRAEFPQVQRGQQIRLALPIRAQDLHDTSLTLQVPHPEHWVVKDVTIGGDTLLVQAGDLPGELLTNRPGRVPLHLGRLRAREELIVQALYMGPLPSAALSYEVSGYEMPAGSNESILAFLPMSCGVPFNGRFQITGRVGVPRGYAFLPEEIVLRDPHKWTIIGVKNGVQCDLVGYGAVPGCLFGEGAQGGQYLPVIHQGSDFLIIAEYAYEKPLGEPFFCGVVGRVVRLPTTSASLDLEKIDQESATHGRLLAFLLGECVRNDDSRVVSITLRCAIGNDYRDDVIQIWYRAKEPALFSEFVGIEKFVGQILEIATVEAVARGKGPHRFVVRCSLTSGTSNERAFQLSH